MTGELVVRPNTPYHFFLALSVWVVFTVFVLMRFKNPERNSSGLISWKYSPR